MNFRMFDFMSMVGTHNDRKIDRYEKDGLFIDTCRVNDGKQPYETAVEHPAYNGGNMVIVEAYDTKEEAQEGHDEWVKKMTAPELPAQLVDCMNAHITDLFCGPLIHLKDTAK